MNSNPPPAPHSTSTSTSTSFPILAISILGILTTAILLLSYYIFVIKCCRNLNWRRGPHLLHLLLPHRLSRSRRRHHFTTTSPPPHPERYPPLEPRGLDSSTINSIPTFRFNSLSTSECSVCLSDFQRQELLRLLPSCGHTFHIDCIDTWLQSNANCPLCRADIIPHSLPPIQQCFPPSSPPQPAATNYQEQDNSSSSSSSTSTSTSTSSSVVIDIVREPPRKKFWHLKSMGDECIDMRGGKDESFQVQPIRRSFSMDSSNDRQLYVSVQEILRQNPSLYREEGTSGNVNAGGRIRRSFFSFGRSSRTTSSAVLPVQSEQHL